MAQASETEVLAVSRLIFSLVSFRLNTLGCACLAGVHGVIRPFLSCIDTYLYAFVDVSDLGHLSFPFFFFCISSGHGNICYVFRVISIENRTICI